MANTIILPDSTQTFVKAYCRTSGREYTGYKVFNPVSRNLFKYPCAPGDAKHNRAMPEKIETKIYKEHFEFVVTGNYDAYKVLSKLSNISVLSASTGLSKVLLDFSGSIGIRFSTEKMLYALKLTELYNKHIEMRGPKLKIAYVSSTSKNIEKDPGLRTARENGIPFELFTNVQDAYAWLELADTRKS